ncbi:MAG: guanylate kinase [Prolixibacteraceae bacterium]|nr:guanylate kinase [Prolixibacteraceae bacterium]
MIQNTSEYKKTGKVLIFSAPSGSGKTTIVRHLLKQNYSFGFSISATSRSPRSTEKNGKDYYFLSNEEFKKKIENEEFLEWQEVYSGTYYGTLKSEVERIRNNGENVLLEIDVLGGINVKKIYGNEALSVFIKAPSLEELKKRLKLRSTDSDEIIRKRIDKAEYELSFSPQFDVILINDNLEDAFIESEKIVEKFLNK